MRIIAYARASTEDQQITLLAQQDKMQGYAALYEHEIVEMIVESESAKSLNRDGIQRALAMLDNGDADGLLVAKLDRLTRELADWQWLIDNYFGERAGKYLFSVADSVDTRSATGRMVLNMILTIAQWERETISERTKAALDHKIKKGERCGGLRYGYDLAPDGKTLVPNQREQEAIALMHRLRGEGDTLQAIANELQARGYHTKEGLTEWSLMAISKILKRARGAA